jgi:hypothetical protein
MPTAWMPLYSMVAFTRIPYSVALTRSQSQDWWMSVFAKSAAVLAVGGAAGVAGYYAKVCARVQCGCALPRRCRFWSLMPVLVVVACLRSHASTSSGSMHSNPPYQSFSAQRRWYQTGHFHRKTPRQVR